MTVQPTRDQPMTDHDRMNYWWRRATQAEARLAGWMEHWNATARTGAVDEVAAILEANARADQAEARIQAVRDVLDRAEAAINRHPAYTWSGQRMHPIVNGAAIRRALDGDQ